MILDDPSPHGTVAGNCGSERSEVWAAVAASEQARRRRRPTVGLEPWLAAFFIFIIAFFSVSFAFFVPTIAWQWQ